MPDQFSNVPVLEKEVTQLTEYKAVRRMPGGGTSNVYEVLIDGQPFAVKASPFNQNHEEVILSQLDHPNILHVLESGKAKLDTSAIPDDKNDGAVVDTLRFKFIPGSLSTLNLSSTNRQKIIDQQRKALAYLHSHGIVHTDIKADNILVDGLTSYLSDFSNARQFSLPAERDEFERFRQRDIDDFKFIEIG